MNKITNFFKKLFIKSLKISAICGLGIFTIYPLGIDKRDAQSIKSRTNLHTSSPFPFNDFVFIGVDVDMMLSGAGIGTIQSTASGIVLNTLDSTKSYIITAGHVCDPSFDQSFRNLPGYEQNVVVAVYDYYGFVHESTILGIDYDHDLCLLSSEDIWTDGTSVSHAIPMTGEKVYAISAPHSIFSPGNALLFDGYFTGFDDSMNAFYTIPTKPGSSGAGIISGEGSILGIIHSAPAEFENLAIASSLENLKEFLSHYVLFTTSF
ncbi:serine protease [bacterium]|nr:serine protease [bacterium]